MGLASVVFSFVFIDGAATSSTSTAAATATAANFFEWITFAHFS